MAGYMTMGRVHGGRVHAIAGRADRVQGAHPVHDSAVSDARRADAPAPTPPPTLHERWETLREELGMMTFFLLDPESWR